MKPLLEMKIDHSELKQLLCYNAEAGIFTWLVRRPHDSTPGAMAGTLNPSGYVNIQIKRKMYSAHRLAWFYMTGKWPEGNIDHIDGNKRNNAIINLRQATTSQNLWNAKTSKSNTSGVKGVSWDEGRQKWRAQVHKNGKSYTAGSFSSIEKASMAIQQLRSKLHDNFCNHGA